MIGKVGTMSEIHFGTDGWRAIIAEDFNEINVARVAAAAAKVFLADNADACVIIGYDCRRDADRYARLVGEVVAGCGVRVKLSDAFCPTPTLCWSVAHDDEATGGIILTASHNPAEYLGIKLRMSDGGASPVTFTDRVEAALVDEAPTARGEVALVDLMTPYLDNLASMVDAPKIAQAHLHVVVDPLYGAGRGYLKRTLEKLGVTVDELHGGCDPTFGGLHPEPIKPWVDEACERVVELGYDAGLVTDGDADRIGAVDSHGNFVNPHRILCLIVDHLASDKGMTGRVVSTVSASTMVKRQCERLGLTYTEVPVGFKWIYGEMVKGDVMVGGEESGGIGIPGNVRERDGLLMACMLCELMAEKGKNLGELLDDMFAKIGEFQYKRRDLRITQEQKDAFLANHPRWEPTEIAGLKVERVNRLDGIRLELTDGAWLLMRASGTEPLVRVYAESQDADQVEALLDAGCAFARGE